MPQPKPIQKEIHIRHPVWFKIFLVSLIPTAALLAAALLNNQYLTTLGESAEHILSKNYKSIKAAQDARKTLEEIRNQLLGQVSLGRTSAPISLQMLEHLFLNLATCRENVTETGERELIEHLIDLYHRFEPMVHAAGQSKWPDSQV